MTPNDKQKSFFERLTQGMKPETETQPKMVAEQIKRVDFREAGPTQPAAPKPAAKKQQAAPSTASAPKSEEWIGEAQEGQLTVDVYQTDTEIVIKSTVAGVNPEDLDIAITNDMVTIRGKRSHDEEVKGEQYIYQECYWGAFSRSIILPTDVAADRAEATLHNGILAIHLPKIEKEQTKKLKVKPIP